MTIHNENPFADPEDPVRRFRGRLGGAVSLWTSGEGAARAGLSVSSLMVANGSPAYVLGLLDTDSDLFEVLTGTGLGVVQLLRWADHALADVFGGVGPAPGGPFASGTWEQTSHGPALVDRTRALVALRDAREIGWSTLVTVEIEEILVEEDVDPLEHRRGRYTGPHQPH